MYSCWTLYIPCMHVKYCARDVVPVQVWYSARDVLPMHAKYIARDVHSLHANNLQQCVMTRGLDGRRSKPLWPRSCQCHWCATNLSAPNENGYFLESFIDPLDAQLPVPLVCHELVCTHRKWLFSGLLYRPFRRAAASAAGVRCLCSQLSGHCRFIQTTVQHCSVYNVSVTTCSRSTVSNVSVTTCSRSTVSNVSVTTCSNSCNSCKS